MKTLLLLFVCLLMAGTSLAQGYNKKTIKSIEKALGKDVRKFKFFSYPTDNFGIATSYKGQDNDLQRICATWSCIGIDYTKIPKGKDWLNVNGFADVGAGGKEISLKEKVKNDLSISTVLPKIYNVLNVEGGFDKSTIINTDLKIGKVFKRSLNVDKLRKEFSTSSNQTLKEVFDDGGLAYVVSDIVIESMSVTIKINSTAAAKIDAKLEGLTSKMISDASVSVGFKKERDGEYTFVFDNPVIVARISKRQPAAQKLENTEKIDISTWEDVETPDETQLKTKSNEVTGAQ